MELGPIARSLFRRKSASALLVMEVAVGMVVLVHNSVLGRYYSGLAFTPSGLDEPNLVYLVRRFDAPETSEDAVRAQTASDLARLAAMNGVVAAAAVDEFPFPENASFCTALWSDTGARPSTGWAVQATDGIADALGLRISEGRAFARGETGTAIISRQLSKRMFPRGGAVGHWLTSDGMRRARIVGVAEEFRMRMPFAPDSASVALLSASPGYEWEIRYVVRSAPGRREDVLARAPAMLSAPPASAAGGNTVTAARFDSLASRFHRIARGATVVIIWMSLIVVGVALAGALAVVSFSVAERTRQIGVRRALGSTRGRIVRYFLLENALVTTTGIAVGLAATMPINALVRRLLPNLALTWPDLVVPMILFWGAGLLSALIPALRAARIPPTAATRIV